MIFHRKGYKSKSIVTLTPFSPCVEISENWYVLLIMTEWKKNINLAFRENKKKKRDVIYESNYVKTRLHANGTQMLQDRITDFFFWFNPVQILGFIWIGDNQDDFDF